MKKNILFLVFLVVYSAGSYSQITGQGSIDPWGKPKFLPNRPIPNDTITLYFSLLNPDHTRAIVLDRNQLKQTKVDINEFRDGNMERNAPEPLAIEPCSITGIDSRVRSNLEVLLLIDRSGSMDNQEIEGVKNATRRLLSILTDTKVKISFFHTVITTNMVITPGNIDEIFRNNVPDETVRRGKFETALNTTICLKLGEMAKDTSSEKYLIVFTDGENYINRNKITYLDRELQNFSQSSVIELARNEQRHVKVITIGFRQNNGAEFDKEFLQNLASASIPGHPLYDEGNIDNIKKIFERIGNELLPDYQLKMINPNPKGDKIYEHEPRSFDLTVTVPSGNNYTGTFNFRQGSKEHPFTPETESSFLSMLLIGFALGIGILLFVLFIVQYLFLYSRNKIFEWRYVKRYKPDKARPECYLYRNCLSR